MNSQGRKLTALYLVIIMLFSLIAIPGTGLAATQSGGNVSIHNVGNAPDAVLNDATIDDSSSSDIEVAFDASSHLSDSSNLAVHLLRPNGSFIDSIKNANALNDTGTFTIPSGEFHGGEIEVSVDLVDSTDNSEIKFDADKAVITTNTPVKLENTTVSPTTVSTGENVTTTVTLNNTASSPKKYTLVLWNVFGDGVRTWEKSKTVEVSADSVQQFTLNRSYASKDTNVPGIRRLMVNEESPTPITVNTDPTGFINGTVRNSSGDPVSNVDLKMLPAGGGVTQALLTTDSNGKYSQEISTGSYDIFVDDSEYTFDIKPDKSVSENSTTVVDLQVQELPDQGTLEGTVRDPDGNIVQGATIRARDDSFRFFNSTVSDTQGDYSLKLAEANYTVRVTHPNHATKTVENVEITANETTDLSVNFPEVTYINGSVTKADGSPPQSAVVIADSGDNFGLSPVDSSTGQYNISVPEDEYTVTVFSQSGVADSQQITTDPSNVSEANFNLKQVNIEHESVEVTSGAGSVQTSDIGIRTGIQQGLLQVQVVDETDPTIPKNSPGPPSELEELGVDDSTEFRINITATNFSANSLMWGINNARWNTTDNESVTNGTDITVRGSAVQLQATTNGSAAIGPLFQQSPNDINWPTGQKDQADIGRNETIFFGIFDLANMPPQVQNNLNGMSVTTNAQMFDTPSVVNNTLNLWVAGPSKTTTGQDHSGFYQAEIPQSQLDDWNVTDPVSELNALYKGDSANFTVTDTNDGARIRLENISYSAGFVEVQAVPQPDTGGSDGSSSSGSSDESESEEPVEEVSIPPEAQAEGSAEPEIVKKVEPEEVESETPGQAVSRMRASIDNVASNKQVAVVIPDETEGVREVEEETGTQLSTIDFTPALAGTADVEISSSASPPDDTPDLDTSVKNTRSLSYSSVNINIREVSASRHPMSLRDVFSANFTFKVRKSRVAELTGFPENIVMYHYSAEEWRAIPTRQINETESHYVFRARSAGFSVFAIAVQDPEFSVESPSLSRSDISPGDEVTVAADIQNSGNGKETFTAELTVDGDIVDKQAVIVDAGETEEVAFTHEFTEQGRFNVAVSGETAGTVNAATPTPSPTPTTSPTPTPTATPVPTPTPTIEMTPTPVDSPRVTVSSPETEAPGLDGFGFGVALVAIVTVALLASRRRV